MTATAGELRSFAHDGLSFDYSDSGGDGEPVVLLHGYPADHQSWDAVVPELVAGGFRVLALDQRGYSPGARPRGRRAYALDCTVGDLFALCDAVGAGRVHVVGHDWGGAVGWAAAASHPARLATLTSLTVPHPRAMLRSLLSSDQALRSWYVLVCQLPWLPEAAVASERGGRWFVAALAASGLSPERAERYLALLRSGAAGPAINWYRAIPFNRPGLSAEVSVPTLLVHAAGDIALARRGAELTARYVTGPYRLEVLEASHWLPEDHADAVVPVLLEHLRAHPV